MGVSLLLLTYLLAFHFSFVEIRAALLGVDFRYYLLAYAFSLFGISLSVLRWKAIISYEIDQFSFATLFKLYFIGIFYNVVIPGSISGDVVRAYKTSKSGDGSVGLFVSVPLERITGLIALTIIMIFSVLFLFDDLPNVLVLQLLLVIAVIWGALLMVISNRTANLLVRVVERSPLRGYSLTETINRVSTEVQKLRDVRLLVTTVGFSVGFFVCTFFITYFIALAVGVHIPLLFLAAVLPIVTIITVVPITYVGLGIREGLYVYFFGFVGVDPGTAVAIGLVSITLRFLNSLVGGLLDLRHRP